MNRPQVHSSNVRSVGYDPASMTLEVEFHSGRVYQYFSVPETIYREFMSSVSKGSYFHKHIKGQYLYTQVR